MQRFPRAAVALISAGVLFAGAAVAASAHQFAGTSSFDDEQASAPRVEQPEPTESPELDETVPVVVTTPTPEPTETPEVEPSETPEAEEETHEAPAAATHEHEQEGAGTTTTQRQGDDESSGSEHDR
jgi:outer membrane biosynthesis protein TonB